MDKIDQLRRVRADQPNPSDAAVQEGRRALHQQIANAKPLKTSSSSIAPGFRTRLAWTFGAVAVTGAAAAALIVAATLSNQEVVPVVGSTAQPTVSASEEQPELTEAEAIAGCVDAWKPAPGALPQAEYESLYVNDKTIANVVDGEWQITLVPTQQVEAEWNYYCTTDGNAVSAYTNGYETWPTSGS